MKADIIKIGNSQGIRIPKKILEQCDFNSKVEMEVSEGMLFLKPARDVRDDWEAACKAGLPSDDEMPIFGEGTIKNLKNASGSYRISLSDDIARNMGLSELAKGYLKTKTKLQTGVEI